jgi:hypothetical protein
VNPRRAKRLVIGAAVVTVLFVVAVYFALDFAFAEKVSPTKPLLESPTPTAAELRRSFVERGMVPDELSEFVRSFASSTWKRKTAEACERIDASSLYLRARRVDRSPAPALPKFIGEQSRLLFPALVDSFGRSGMGLPWHRIELCAGTVTDGGTGFLLDALHSDGDDVCPVRWTFEQSRTGWQLVDLEELRTGLRLSRLFASNLETGLEPSQKGEWAQTAAGLRDGQLDRVNPVGAPGWVGEIFTKRREKPQPLDESLFGPTPATIAGRVADAIRQGDLAAAAERLAEGRLRFPVSPTLDALATVLGW